MARSIVAGGIAFALVAGGAATGPAKAVTATPTRTATPTHASTAAAKPPVANVGRMPAGFRFTSRMSRDSSTDILGLCWLGSGALPALARRRASLFGVTVSDTAESGSMQAGIVMRDVASAKRLMAQVRGAARRCQSTDTVVGRSAWAVRMPVKGRWDESVALNTQALNYRDGSVADYPWGRSTVVARRGRSVAASSVWMMPWAPRTEGDRGIARSEAKEVATLLGRLPR